MTITAPTAKNMVTVERLLPVKNEQQQHKAKDEAKQEQEEQVKEGKQQ
jgi:hypothetical protein